MENSKCKMQNVGQFLPAAKIIAKYLLYGRFVATIFWGEEQVA